MKILIACEYSGIVRDAFAKKGHDVMSCDILPTESEGKHYQGDALENPVSVISSKIRKPNQIIQPWQFGHEAQKTTCLWLKNLPHLKHTKVVSKGEFTTFKSGKKHPKWYADALKLSKHERMKVRSKTFQGIAQAMAEQWSKPYEDFKQIEMDLRMIVSTD